MEKFDSMIISIVAGIIANYISKRLDRYIKNDN